MKSILKTKNYLIFIMIAFVLLCVPFVFSACSFSAVTSIEVDASSIPTESVEAGSFDVTTLKIILKKADETTQIIPGSKMMFTATDYAKLKVVGTQTLKVKYMDKETSFQISIYPYGNPPKYTINFIDQNPKISTGEDNVVYTYQVPIKETLQEIPSAPVVAGYDVIWSVSDFSQVNSNINVYAIYTPIKYTVTFNYNNGTGQKPTKDILYNSKIGTMPTPTHTTKVFSGWEYNNVFYTENDLFNLTENITFTAKFEIVAAVKVELCDEVNPIIPSEFVLNEELDLSNYDVKVTYNNGTTEIMSINTATQTFSSDGFDTSTIGENKELVITYRNPSTATIKTIKITHKYGVYQKYNLSLRLAEGCYEGEYELLKSDGSAIAMTKTFSSFDDTFTNYAISNQVYKNNIDELTIKIKPHAGYTYEFVKTSENPAYTGTFITITKVLGTTDGYDYYKLSNIDADGTINVAFEQMKLALTLPTELIEKTSKITINSILDSQTEQEEVTSISETKDVVLDQESQVELIFEFNVNIQSFVTPCNYIVLDCEIVEPTKLKVIIRTNIGGTEFSLTDLGLVFAE